MTAFLSRTVLGALFAVAAGMLPAAHGAPSFPSKPIRLIVGFPPGTATDIVARQVAERLTQEIGWTIVVENKVGQSGSMAAYEVSRGEPDGYTLLMSASAPLSINPNLYNNVRYDPTRDFTPITLVAVLPYVLVAKADSPLRSVKDVIAAAKAQPEKLNYASPGNGTTGHLIAATFAQQTGTRYTHVPYRGSAESLVGMISGSIDIMFDTSVVTVPQIRSGKLRALAVTTARRIDTLPDVPTMAEAAIPGFEMTAWLGLVAPPGMPEALKRQLNADIVKVLNTPQMKSQLARFDAQVTTSTPEAFGAFMANELKKWGTAVRDAGAKVD